MTRLALILGLLAVAAAGCGQSNDTTPDENKKSRLVDFSLQPPFVNALEIDPGTGDFLLTTNRGFWRIAKNGGKVTQIKGKISAEGKSDTVGTFLEIEAVGGERLIGSGHPDTKGALPEYLGFIESPDLGKTWRVVSRLGEADLHKVLIRHGRLYGWDAVLQALLISRDNGRTFEERFTPSGLVIDFVVDPQDPEYVLAATEDQLYKSENGGESWRPATPGEGIRLDWPAPETLIRADKDGTIQTSTNRGQTWSPIGKVDGEPYKFKAVDAQHLYLALSDGTILETTDGGRTFEERFRP